MCGSGSRRLGFVWPADVEDLMEVVQPLTGSISVNKHQEEQNRPLVRGVQDCIFLCMCVGVELLRLVVSGWDEMFLPVWSVTNTNLCRFLHIWTGKTTLERKTEHKEALIYNSWWKVSRSAREMESAHLKAGRWPRHGVGLTGRRWQQKWQQGGGWSIFEICERASWIACLWVWKFLGKLVTR